MTIPQSAILPEAGPFAQYTLLKVTQEPAAVLEQLQALPTLVEAVSYTHLTLPTSG